MNIYYLLENLSQFIYEIVRLHSVHSSFESDQCPKFTSRFWKSLQEDSRTHNLIFSSIYRP